MVERETLLALAERCEMATGPDRELDVAIAVAFDWRWDDWEEGESTARGQAEKHGLDWLVERAEHGMASMWRHIPRYTASLDAAMSLVPEGWCWLVADSKGKANASKWGGRYQYAKGWASLTADDDAMTNTRCNAETPALALCAAALRARGKPQ